MLSNGDNPWHFAKYKHNIFYETPDQSVHPRIQIFNTYICRDAAEWK
jgi:hypothetical protein